MQFALTGSRAGWMLLDEASQESGSDSV